MSPPLPLFSVAPQPLGEAPAAQPSASGFALSLMREGHVSPHAFVEALSLQKRHGGQITDILLSRNRISPSVLLDAQARHWAAALVDPTEQRPDRGLIEAVGAAHCLRAGLLPFRRVEGRVQVATAHPEDFARHRRALEHALGPVEMVLAPASAILSATIASEGRYLGALAEMRTPLIESCREWGGGSGRMFPVLGALLLLFFWMQPMVLGSLLLGWALLTLLAVTLLRIAAAFASLRAPRAAPAPPAIARLPKVSIMIALYQEHDIAPRLIRRLDKLDYPRDLLDVLILVEAEDLMTRETLAKTILPAWIRVITVPPGTIKTKPRALNFGLDLCRGSLIGVYDAEDAPEPQQLRKMVAHFYRSGPELACLQGVLDFYNPRTNWLSRCFTMEYAVWFRLLLPGLQRLGLAFPLGGTTLFFRRSALEALGGWDAHNVTEDADLGIRLARHGYRAELLDSVTEEEANCRALPWVRQRSRWLKGYMMTWGVHMRRPVQLWRQLGPWKFWGFQILFLSTVSQFLLAPILWSFWLIPLGVSHPVTAALSENGFLALMALFILAEVVNITLTLLALRKTRHGLSWLWAFSLHFYFPLGALASYKAAWEMICKPFYWDKTSHGHFDAPLLHKADP
jgi:glycosyltransferase XagB